MSSQATRERAVLAYVVGILGSFLIVGALAWAIYRYTQPAPLGEDRAAFRAKNLTELRAAEHEALDTIAWLDPAKGIVRLRIEDAMNLVELAWRNPPAARSNLIARVEKRDAVPPNPFE